MSVDLNETFEEQEAREKLENFYGDFSAQARRRLLKSNITRPENIYEVLYTPVRTNLLSKNIVKDNVDLEEKSKEIRNSLLLKQVEKDIDIEKSGENIRKSLLAKNDLINSTLSLEKNSEKVRENLLSKNGVNKNDLEDLNKGTRENLLSKNSNNSNDLETQSHSVRENLLHKNNADNNSVETNSESVRSNLLTKNLSTPTDLENTSVSTRENLLSKNNNKHQNIDDGSSSTKENLLAKNSKSEIDVETNSAEIRKNLKSNTVSNDVKIDTGTNEVRTKLESKNLPGVLNVETGSNEVRTKLESKNTSNGLSPEVGSNSIREKLLSNNVPSGSNPETGADAARKNLLSNNIANGTNPETGSESVRKNLLSNNISNGANPETGADTARKSLLSNNVPSGTNPETGSDTARNNLLSQNVPSLIDVETNSKAERDDLLSKNVPSPIDVETNSKTERDGLLSKNVPDSTDVETNSKAERDGLLSKNVPNILASPEFNSDLDRNNLLDKNVPSPIDVETNSKTERDGLLGKNVPNLSSTPETGSNSIREGLLSNNVQSDIGALDKTGNVQKNLLLSTNVPKNIDLDNYSSPFRDNLLSKNPKIAQLGANVMLPAGQSIFVGVSNLEIQGEIIRKANELIKSIFPTKSTLQRDYGLSIENNNIGQTTKAIQLYNLEQNTFPGKNAVAGGNAGLDGLKSNHNDGFQKLLSSLGNFNKKGQIQTNSTPLSVISHGNYLSQDSEGILKTGTIDAPLGTPESMMAQTEPSDAITSRFDIIGKDSRGVRYIINTIRNKDKKSLRQNYDSQNAKSFIIGKTEDGKNYKKSRTRFTIANPYAPSKDAGTLEFKITNYAIPIGENSNKARTMSFPPYIKSFGHDDSATWTSTLFLGRPEPLFTYSNSSRKGTISFFILTDYAQSVDIGYDYDGLEGTESNFNGTNSDILTEDFTKNFTDNTNIKDIINSLESQTNKIQLEILKLKSKREFVSKINDDVSDISTLDVDISEKTNLLNALQSKINELSNNKNAGSGIRDFSEGKVGSNVYNINDSPEADGEFISTRLQKTTDILNNMKKDLKFQPAFFSGSKIDFVRRLEFIAKLTRPAKKDSVGFSFTTPPVSHMHLGDWFNHDVIIESVGYDYSDAPWTFDGDRVQPMWVTITLGFNIIGFYGAPKDALGVPLATDEGGYFQHTIQR